MEVGGASAVAWDWDGSVTVELYTCIGRLASAITRRTCRARCQGQAWEGQAWEGQAWGGQAWEGQAWEGQVSRLTQAHNNRAIA